MNVKLKILRKVLEEAAKLNPNLTYAEFVKSLN